MQCLVPQRVTQSLQRPASVWCPGGRALRPPSRGCSGRNQGQVAEVSQMGGLQQSNCRRNFWRLGKEKFHCFKRKQDKWTQDCFSGRIYESSRPLAETGNSFWGKLSVKRSVVEFFGHPLAEFYSHSGSGPSFPCQNIDFPLQLLTRLELGNTNE